MERNRSAITLLKRLHMNTWIIGMVMQFPSLHRWCIMRNISRAQVSGPTNVTMIIQDTQETNSENLLTIPHSSLILTYSLNWKHLWRIFCMTQTHRPHTTTPKRNKNMMVALAQRDLDTRQRTGKKWPIVPLLQVSCKSAIERVKWWHSNLCKTRSTKHPEQLSVNFLVGLDFTLHVWPAMSTHRSLSSGRFLKESTGIAVTRLLFMTLKQAMT